MQVTETRAEGLKRAYAVKVPAAALGEKVAEKLEAVRADFQMKGFRKGKAPVPLLKKMFGKSVLGEAVQETVDDALRSHFETTGDQPASQPDIKIANEDFKEGDDLDIEIAYERLPEIPEIDFRSISLERLVAEVEDGAVGEALDNLARTAENFEAKEGAAAEGDQVVIDFVGSVDGEKFEGGAAEDYPLVIGSNSFIPGFEPQLVGAAAGEEREVKVSFPENYGAPNLAGRDAVFACTVKEVRGPVPAQVDDALAQKFGAEDLEALKGQIRERLGEEYKGAARALLKRRLLDALDERAEFDLPESLVDIEAKQIAHQLWHEEHKDVQGHDHPEIEPDEEHLKLARRRVGLGLLLAEVGKTAEVRISNEEMTQAIMAQARQYPGQERAFFDFVRQNEQALAQIRAPLYEDKVIDYILELATITERTVTKDELQAEFDKLDEA
ncbi:trigger factor [Rubrimonas cliftonensis]|uniref:Trigger factor n=1 Tax=Rubrimonas cliftonensis TaxID=89524 RepID=A0A1H4DAA4_9RHOB|nr:trigger factor [Rubrimonas cliftonensis]SEA69446.1 trigger factor [Rubrimonas cliftonensis]